MLACCAVRAVLAVMPPLIVTNLLAALAALRRDPDNGGIEAESNPL
jgi:hypothetical protein